MTNLLTVLPDFDTRVYSHILPSLERALISTADLLTLDAFDVAKRAQVPPREVKTLADAVIDALHERSSHAIELRCASLSVLDDEVDAALSGGIQTGHLTEIVGESAAGKTQFLLTLLLSVQLAPPYGLAKSALYISTEAPLQTVRLLQILKTHPKLRSLPTGGRPSLDRVQSAHIHDLEAQEHILRYQVPVAIKRHDVGLVVIDSIAANFRPEFAKGKAKAGGESLAKRNAQLAQLGALLRALAREHNIAIVLANQVADRFAPLELSSQGPTFSQTMQQTRPNTPFQSLSASSGKLSEEGPVTLNTPPPLSTCDDPLALDHQQRFFTGWGDDPSLANLKTPSLGLTWTNQLSARIALLKEPCSGRDTGNMNGETDISSWRRTLKVVFCSWSAERSVHFQITEGGVRSVSEEDHGRGQNTIQ